MKRILISLNAILLFILTVDGQNLFFIDKLSYPCTDTINLQSNSNNHGDLDILLAKDGKSGLFAVITESYSGMEFSNQLFIYLEDGSVINLIDQIASENVDFRAISLYSLTSDQLNKLKNSNIHTVRYTLELRLDKNRPPVNKKNWSASNTGTPTKTIVTEFFKE
ncbi:MAG: hypothetical protein KQI35_01195 [Bacteroidetes bacterium]|nr:hypothetical protein [Bacteroidota bacterium]